jgi:hypothetical protein
MSNRVFTAFVVAAIGLGIIVGYRISTLQKQAGVGIGGFMIRAKIALLVASSGCG